MRHDLKSAGEGIKRSAQELELRDRAVSDFLRDYFNAEVARSNLKLQRTVYWLTVIATLIALLALAVQFVALETEVPPEQTQESVFESRK